MEIKLESTTCRYLKQIKWETKSQEQTQELRIPDGMPDIGSILGAWGQVLIRGKEWNRGSVGVSGGVMCWVMYAPEDGSQPQMVEAWLPFQMKWDISDPGRDGTVCVRAHLRHVDGRNTSARKLMVRASAEVLAQVLIPDQVQISTVDQLPKDVEVLKKHYPMELMTEAGEKNFEIEEKIQFPASAPEPESLIYYSFQPEIIEHKLMGDKVVFRGICILHLLYRTGEGQLHTWDFEIPFSQYAELDKTCDIDRKVRIIPLIAGLEVDREEDGTYQMKASLVCQYLVSQRSVIEIVEDAYSPVRSVAVKTQMLPLPGILSEKSETIRAEQLVETDNRSVSDVTLLLTEPRMLQTGDQTRLELGGSIQLMCQQPEGNPEGYHASWENVQILDTPGDVLLNASVCQNGVPGTSFVLDGVQVHMDVTLEMCCMMQEGIPMVTSLELGEASKPNPDRPGLILRKAGEDSLWTLAKKYGSTVQTIQKANQLEGEPEPDKVLLIPIS